MAQPNWTIDNGVLVEDQQQGVGKVKLALFALVLLSVVGFLVTQAIKSDGQFFITVSEYFAAPDKYAERDFRISAWVDGDTIEFTQVDDFTSLLEFDIVDSLENPGERLHVIAYNQPQPDLLQHEAQALVEGRVGADGHMIANADGVLLKCPTKTESGEAYAFEAHE